MSMESNPANIFEKDNDFEKIEGKIINFQDEESGKDSLVKVSKLVRFLGAGGYGRVLEVEVDIIDENNHENTRSRRMALKQYSKDNTGHVGYLKKAQKNFRLLKGASIPTWTTYRINLEHAAALMTLGTSERGVILTVNDDFNRDKHPSVDMFKENPVVSVCNTDDFIKSIEDVLHKLFINKLTPDADSWGIVFKPVGNIGVYSLEILIADLDSLQVGDVSMIDTIDQSEPDWNLTNRQNIINCLEGVLGYENIDSRVDMFGLMKKVDDLKYL